MTSLRGGSNGAGVPLPIHTNANTHHNAANARPCQKTRWQIDEQKSDKERGIGDCPEEDCHFSCAIQGR
jgi:hypothetical protein